MGFLDLSEYKTYLDDIAHLSASREICGNCSVFFIIVLAELDKVNGRHLLKNNTCFPGL